MRPLTPSQADVLRGLAAPSGPGIEFDEGDPIEQVCNSLVARGCVRGTCGGEEGGYEITLYDITDLGRLALRVAVPTAGVPL